MEKSGLMTGAVDFMQVCHGEKGKTSRNRLQSKGNIVFSVLPSSGVP